jgi:hypothetical protein
MRVTLKAGSRRCKARVGCDDCTGVIFASQSSEVEIQRVESLGSDDWTGEYKQNLFILDTVTLAASGASILKLEIFSIDAEADLSQFAPFLQIPSLLTFNAHDVSYEMNSQEHLQFDGLQHGRFSVKDLSLLNINLNSIMLKTFLGCFSRLETLHYEHNGPYFFRSYFKLIGMMEALQNLKATLK